MKKLKKIQLMTAIIKCETGLHIGGSDAEMHIGGIDNPVIKNPFTKEPYIPGSSLKGKIRSLLEWKTGVIEPAPFSWKTYQNETAATRKLEVKKILQLFGVAGSDQLTPEQAGEIGQSRLSFWDSNLTRSWVEQIQQENMLFVEAKTENSINRISGTADYPRQMERVPAGSEFEFRLSIKTLEEDPDWISYVVKALQLLELDSLGGSGTRGYGKIKFKNLKVDGQPIAQELLEKGPFVD